MSSAGMRPSNGGEAGVEKLEGDTEKDSGRLGLVVTDVIDRSTGVTSASELAHVRVLRWPRPCTGR